MNPTKKTTVSEAVCKHREFLLSSGNEKGGNDALF